jgi:opacity protein-like surface antigen
MKKKMGKVQVVLAVIFLAGGIVQQAVAAEEEKPKNYVQGQLGMYQPASDLDDNNFDTGFNGTIGYGRYLTDNLIFETSIDSFVVDRDSEGSTSSAGNYTQDDDLIATGILITLKGEVQIGAFDLFGGGGVGVYGVAIDSDIDTDKLGSFSKSESDGVYGVHAVLGANYNITNHIFVGLEAKYRWTGDVDLKESVASVPVEYKGDLSGYAVLGTFGIRF